MLLTKMTILIEIIWLNAQKIENSKVLLISKTVEIIWNFYHFCAPPIIKTYTNSNRSDEFFEVLYCQKKKKRKNNLPFGLPSVIFVSCKACRKRLDTFYAMTYVFNSFRPLYRVELYDCFNNVIVRVNTFNATKILKTKTAT